MFSERGPNSLYLGNAELNHGACSLSAAFSEPLTYPRVMSIPGKAAVRIVPQASVTWSPFLHKVSREVRVVPVNNLENADVDTPPSLISSLRTSASSLLWPKLTMRRE